MLIIYCYDLDIKTHFFKCFKEKKYYLLLFLTWYNLSLLAHDSEFQLEYSYNENYFYVEKVGISDFASNTTVNKNTINEYSLNSLSISEKQLYLSFQALSQEDIYPIKFATISADILNYLFSGDSSNCVITTPTTTTETPTASNAPLTSTSTFQPTAQFPFFSFDCYGGAGFDGGEPPRYPQHTRDKNCPRCSGGVCVESTTRQGATCLCYKHGYQDGWIDRQNNYGGVSSVASLRGAAEQNLPIQRHSHGSGDDNGIYLPASSLPPPYYYGGVPPVATLPSPYYYGGVSSVATPHHPHNYGDVSSASSLHQQPSTKKVTALHHPALEELFKSDPYPNHLEKEKCAMKLGLTFTQVSTWLANRRRREKRNTSETKGNIKP